MSISFIVATAFDQEMGKNFTKRMLALIVALTMVLTMVPAGVLSAEADAGYPVVVEYQTGETPGWEVVAPDYSYPGYIVKYQKRHIDT